jgi:hypothetical protein
MNPWACLWFPNRLQARAGNYCYSYCSWVIGLCVLTQAG